MPRPRFRYQGLPKAMLFRMLLGIFLLFAPTMILATSHFEPSRPAPVLIFWAVISGLIGVGYALAAMLTRRVLFIVIPAHFLVIYCFTHQLPPGLGIGKPAP